MKLVYSYYVLDIIHKGHLLMMKNSKAIAGNDGKLIVGILTDEAAMEKKKKPVLSFSERIDIASSIKYVDVVVAQTTYSPLQNIKNIKPDILMENPQHDRGTINKLRKFMESIEGRVIELPYFPEQSSTFIKNRVKEIE